MLTNCSVGGGWEILIPQNLERVFSNFERISSRVVTEALRPGDVFVDVGANFGFYSVLARSVVGEAGAVIAIEPSPGALNILKVNTSPFSNITVIESCVSEYVGERKFYLTDDYVNSGVMPNPPFIPSEEVSEITVSSSTLDEILIERCGVGSIDFLKVDVQGDDVGVLRSGKRVLSQSKRVRLLVEWAPTWMSNAGFDPETLPFVLRDLGFTNIVCVDDWKNKICSVDEFWRDAQRDVGGKRYCNLFASKHG